MKMCYNFIALTGQSLIWVATITGTPLNSSRVGGYFA